MRTELRLTLVLGLALAGSVPYAVSATPPQTGDSAEPPVSDTRVAWPAIFNSPKAAVATAQLSGRLAAFVENKGQWDAHARFRLVTGGKTIWLGDSRIVFDVVRDRNAADSPQRANGKEAATSSRRLHGRAAVATNKRERLAFSEQWIGASAPSSVEPIDPQPGTYNYFVGNDKAHWRTSIHGYGGVIYHDVWQGVDVRLVSKGADVEQEFIVRPGADTSKIQMAYRGVKSLEIANDGSLLVHTALGDLRETNPRIYQDVHGARVRVAGHFRLTGKAKFAFDVESYNPTYALVIDPTLLYSTFLGGSVGYGCGPFSCATGESAQAIAVDAAGNAYVTGFTQSLDFPTTFGAVQSTTNTSDAFVTKLNPIGSQLVYSTYLGPAAPSGASLGYGIALDAAQEVYVTGTTLQGAFPTTANAYGQVCPYGGSFFFTKLNAAGNNLVYSTCFGSTYFSVAYAIAVDSSGKAYITGNDTTGGLPITAGAYQPKYAGGGYGGDAFLTVFDPAASGAASLVYSTYLGGSSDDIGFAVAVDAFGMAYVTGSTLSTNFPVTPGAFQATYPGAAEDVFVAKFNPSASGPASLIYSTYLGGNGITPGASSGGVDIGRGIAVDALGQAHVAGSTGSANFPTTPGAFRTSEVWRGGFVATLNAAGNGLVWSTFLGGSSGDQNYASAIALDLLGNTYVTGTTGAPDFPTTPTAFQPTLAGPLNAFVTELNPTGTALVYSSYLGGSKLDQGYGIAVDAVGDAYVTGYTESVNFPVTPFALQPAINLGGPAGPADAFVTKFPLGPPAALSIAGILPSAGGNAGSATVTVIGTDFHNGVALALSCPGQSVIAATNVDALIGGRTLSGTFALTGATPGICDVVITSPDGTTSTLSQGFTIDSAGGPDIWIDLVGLPGLRYGTQQIYGLVYGNRGNTDSPTIRLWVSFNSFLSWGAVANHNPASQGTINGTNFLAFDVSPTAGSSGFIPFALSAPNSHNPFFIQAWEQGR